MKFLALGRTSAGQTTSANADLIKEGTQQFQNDDRTIDFYGFAGEWLALVICDVESNEELNEYLFTNPLTVLTDWEVHPLLTPNEVLNQMDKVSDLIQKRAA